MGFSEGMPKNIAQKGVQAGHGVGLCSYHMLMRQILTQYGLSSRKRPHWLDILGGRRLRDVIII